MAAPEPVFDAPVPGSGLTAEPGSRSWKNPPQYSSVEDAVDYYVTRLSSDEVANQVVSVLDMGVPVTDLANIMQTHGIMEGKHTLDVSMLILPVLMEVIALIGDTAGIDYSMGTEKDDPERIHNSVVRGAKLRLEKELQDKTLDNLGKKEEEVEPEEVQNEMADVEEPVIPTGLMARRS
jgi:hypothetical protein|tara:strand:- start:206 stop:742 length:537 start_codon:yes stop_codon:yes gene_type:complete